MNRDNLPEFDSIKVCPAYCPSTHGGAGYALGTYWNNGKLVCGLCNEIIKNPAPVGQIQIPWKLKEVRSFKDFIRWFTHKPKRIEPRFPEWIS